MRILFLLPLLLLFGCRATPDAPEGPPNSFAELSALFEDPPASFRSAPLWVWNDDLQEAQIDEQLEDFQTKGIGGVFVHPRPGLITPYLSDRWHALFQYTVEKAKTLGLDVWIYDENSYPSGFAGGHVPARMPESYTEGQGLQMETFRVLPPDSLDFLVVLEKSGDRFVDITPTWRETPGRAGAYYAFARTFYGRSGWFGGFSYVDLLLEGVTDTFKTVTMSGYEASSGHEFGKTVKGVFTDEPNTRPPGGIKYTPDLFDQFEQRWGYDLRTSLPSLFQETGDWRKVRHNYQAVVMDLFVERWAKPWFEYTEEKGLAWTGHYWEHGWPDPSEGPDNMAMYAWHQMPGIDILMNQYSEHVNAQFGNVRAVKELSSVANQMGRRRTLSETYGAGGWELRFVDMKRIADWQYVLGVNFVNPHFSLVTMKGARKRDHPQSFSYHAPWWPKYRVMGDYLGRMSLAMSSGEQVNTTLVIEPTTSGWMVYSPGASHAALRRLGEDFQAFVTGLERRQVEYDLGSEDLIARFGSVESGQLKVGERVYDRVVLPPGLDNLDRKTADLLEEVLKGGGSILSFASLPSFQDGAETTRFVELAAAHPEQWAVDTTGLASPLLDRLADPSFEMVRTGETVGILYHHRRRLADGELWLLTNSSLEESVSGWLRAGGASVRLLDAITGRISPYPYERIDGSVSLSFNLPPSGALLLFVGVEPEAADSPGSGLPVAEEVEVPALGPVQVRRTSPNTLALDYCDLDLGGGSVEKGLYFYRAADRVFRHFGLDGNPWSRAVQFRSDILDKDVFPEGSGWTATYRLEIAPNVDMGSIQVVIERPDLWEVSVNGARVASTPEAWWLDRDFGVYDVGSAVKAGSNEITLAVRRMSIHHELEPLVVRGDFGVEPAERGWRLVPPQPLTLGAWNRQGLSMYAEGIEVLQAFDIAEEGGTWTVRLPEWTGTVASVSVNGAEAGVIGWPPYELDVSGALRPGVNEIAVTVYGSLKNLLGPHHAGPIRGAAWPSQFETAPERQPSGREYDVISYGMAEAFRLVRQH